MIKLLVVDDSPLLRRLLGDLFAAEGDFEVVFARNGAEALEKLSQEEPDVITLDVNMPEMNGLECLDRIMLARPTPVVMASSLTAEGASEAVRSLELGAVDVIAKPSGALSLRMDEFGPALVEKVRGAAGIRMPKARRLRDRLRARLPAPPRAPGPRPRAARSALKQPITNDGLVLVGASTGGPPALDHLLSALPAHFPWPVLVAQHMPRSFTAALAKRLDGVTALNVIEVAEPTLLRPGFVYVARGDADMIVTRRAGALAALSAPADPAYRWHPSVDRLVESALEHLPANQLIGVLMTGMGNDGARAMAQIHQGGGRTLAESEESAVVWGMPGELVRCGGASEVHDIDLLGGALAALARP